MTPVGGGASWELPHVGVVLRRVRESRGIRRADVCRWTGLSSSTVQRLEAEGKGGLGAFDNYVEALSAPGVTGRLSARQAAFLRDAARNSLRAGERQEEVEGLRFSVLTDSPPPPLSRLVQRLEDHPLPAGILDGLGFRHASNGRMFQLYGRSTDDPFLFRWHGWHSIGVSVGPGSPLATPWSHFELAPQRLYLYMLRVQRYLFTRQMAAVGQRLCDLLPDVFPGAWRAATSLLLPYQPSLGHRVIEHDGVQVVLRAMPDDTASVDLVPGRLTTFTLWAWHPQTDASRRVLQGLTGGRLLFARDYDREGDFHINAWMARRGE